MTKTTRLKVSQLPIDADNIALPSLAQFLYCAYGSNLHHDQMARRCPAAKPVGQGELLHHRLVFRGVADMEWAPHSAAPVGLWTVTAKCLEALDIYEGFPSLYVRRLVTVQPSHGKTVRALTYIMRSRDVSPPSTGYLDTIKAGYHHFGLPLTYLLAAAARARKEDTRRGWPDAGRKSPLPFSRY